MGIRLENVSYKDVLSEINLEIKENMITTIMGKSGSGKTTLAEILDLLIFENGSIYFDGQLINKDNIKDLKNKVGLVFQFPEQQFFCSTVEKEISFGLNYMDKDKDKIDKKVLDSLKMVGLDENFLKRKLNSLSNGEKRKVAIASILAFNPSVIILDEPTIGLDEQSKKSLIKILKILKNRYNKSIIIMSRDSEFAHIISDRILVLYNGKLVLSGTKYEVFTSNIEKFGLKRPNIIEFEKMVLKNKNVKLFYRDDINDLMKDVYRNVG